VQFIKAVHKAKEGVQLTLYEQEGKENP